MKPSIIEIILMGFLCNDIEKIKQKAQQYHKKTIKKCSKIVFCFYFVDVYEQDVWIGGYDG